MAKKGKFYVVWFGNPTGIFRSWKECKHAIDGVKGAQYKSFLTISEAKIAYNKEFNDYKGKNTKKKKLSSCRQFTQDDLYNHGVPKAHPEKYFTGYMSGSAIFEEEELGNKGHREKKKVGECVEGQWKFQNEKRICRGL